MHWESKGPRVPYINCDHVYDRQTNRGEGRGRKDRVGGNRGVRVGRGGEGVFL